MDFDTITLTRDIGCPPDRLFHLMTDPGARAAWGGPDAATPVRMERCDVRPGGAEVAIGCEGTAEEFRVLNSFHVVEAPRVLVSTEVMDFGDGPASVSLVTQEIAGTEDGCRLTVTLQVASRIGTGMIAGYGKGWGGSLDQLAALATTGVPA